MTNSHSLHVAPDQARLSFEYDGNECSRSYLPNKELFESSEGSSVSDDQRDSTAATTSTSESSFSELQEQFSNNSLKGTSKKSVCFDQMASQQTVRNLRYDLSAMERRDVWYSSRDIDGFNKDYAKELHLERWRASKQREADAKIAMIEKKKKKSPAQRIRKLFLFGTKVPVVK